MRPQMHDDRIGQKEQTPPSLNHKRKTRKGRWWHVALLIVGILLAGVILLGGVTLNWYLQVNISQAGDPTRTGAVTEYGFPYMIVGMGASVTAGPDGNVWFTNYTMGRIGKITPTGVMTEYTLPSGSGPTYGTLGLAQLIATGSDGNLWYVAQGKIVRISPRGTIIRDYPFPKNFGDSPKGMVGSMVSGPDGNIWYSINDTIVKLTTAGDATMFRLSGNQPYIDTLAAGPDGNVWFSATLDNTPDSARIGRITPTGTISVFPEQFPSGITGLTKGPDGNVWFVGQDSIGRISPSGEVKLFSSSIPLDSTMGVITLGPDGNLWYAAANKMGRITPAGKQTIFSLPHDNAGDVVSMTAGADGNVWYMYSLEREFNPFAAIWGTRIARITP